MRGIIINMIFKIFFRDNLLYNFDINNFIKIIIIKSLFYILLLLFLIYFWLQIFVFWLQKAIKKVSGRYKMFSEFQNCLVNFKIVW